MLWLKTEPFAIGALPGPPPRLTISNIKKIVPYARSKGRPGFPNLSYSVWKHVGCNKLQLQDDVAWTYFLTFDLVNGRSPEQRIEWDKRVAKATDQQAVDSLRSHLTVPCLKFVLFLYIQHIHKISLRASLVSGSDEWPQRARSPDADARTNLKTLDESSNLTFVMTNLAEILELLVESESTDDSGRDGKDARLSVEAVESLGFLVDGSSETSAAGTSKSLVEIAQSQPKSGYSKASQTFSFRSFQSWVRANLAQNPYGVAACIARGRHLCWPMLGETKASWTEKKRGRIATNAPSVPRPIADGNKLVVMSQIGRTTIARSSPTLEGATVKIHRCHDAFIYLLSPLRSVSVEKCQRCTVVLGAVELAVDLARCEQTTVVAACRRFTAVGSRMCAVHVATPTRPIVFGGCESLMFGPYHAHYPKLDEHMASVGLSAQPNLWDEPLQMDAPHQPDEGTAVWHIQNPASFYPFAIPFEMEGSTTEIPGGLPPRYQKALNQRLQAVAVWQNLIRGSNVTKDQKRAFHTCVESRFQEWLSSTGNDRQLEGLVTSSSTSS